MTALEKAYADLYRFNQKKGLKNLIITAIRKKDSAIFVISVGTRAGIAAL